MRAQKLPQEYTLEEEQALLDYYNIALQDLLKQLPHEQQWTLLSYSVVLFKRYYLRYTVLEQPNQLQQVGLICTYLAMKLDDVQRKGNDKILDYANVLRKKQKHKHLIHYGDDKYAKVEMSVVQSLNYNIDVKPLYPAIISYNFALRLTDHLKNFLFDAYQKQASIYVQRAFQGYTIFTNNIGVIALAVVECALESILQQLSLPAGSTMVGAPNRPVDPKDQQRLKDAYIEHQKGKLVISIFLQTEVQSKVLDQNLKQMQGDIQDQIKKPEFNSLIKLLHSNKDTPQLFEKELSKFRRLKQQQQFVHPQPLETHKIIKHP